MSYNTQISLEHSDPNSINIERRKHQQKQHQKIINEIKSKDTGQPNSLQTNPDKTTRANATEAAQKISPEQLFKPKFIWTKDNDNTFNIKPEEKQIQTNSIKSTESNSDHMLSLFGYKIDISTRVNEFQQKFQKFFIESKSHNALIGKFSELKFGMISALLSVLGIEPNTLEKLKKEALKKAIDDNIDCFYQNEYNTELIFIFKRNNKDNTRVKIFTELRKQLIKQMANYGNPNFYTSNFIKSIKKEQIQKILMDLLEEKQNLEYIRSFR